MTGLHENLSRPEELLWHKLEISRSVMIGGRSRGNQLHPMVPQVAAKDKVVWFFASRESDLAKQAQAGNDGTLCTIGLGGGFYAIVHGSLALVEDELVTGRFWSPVINAWFDVSRLDADIAPIAFQPAEATIWSSSGIADRITWDDTIPVLINGKATTARQADIRLEAYAA